MIAFRRMLHELTRQRGHRSHRFYRGGRSSRAGVALLMVLTTLLLMTILVTEIAESAVVRVRMAAHARDEAKAEALAWSGVQIHRLVLIASKQLGANPMISQFATTLGINADTLWQAMPTIDTRFMRLLFVFGEGEDVSSVKGNDPEAAQALNEASREEHSHLDRNFLDFDGDFRSTVTDENRRIDVGHMTATSFAELIELPAAQQLQGLMSGEQQDQFLYRHNLDKWELIGNLVDWTDPDDTRLYQGGSENSLYESLDDPYKSKNAPFDTSEEIRLVDGWQFDQVWYRYGRHLTIYSKGKININTAERRVLEALLMAYIEPRPYNVDYLVDMIMQVRNTPALMGGGLFHNPQQFVNFVRSNAVGELRDDIANAIATQSDVFRVECAGQVGEAEVKVTAVFDFSSSVVGEVVYWRVE